MNKKNNRVLKRPHALLALILSMTLGQSAFGDINNIGMQPSSAGSEQQLSKEILTLGNYLGYDLTKKPSQFTDQLFSQPPLVAGLQLFSPAVFLGIMPAGTPILPKELLNLIIQNTSFQTIFSQSPYNNTQSAANGLPSMFAAIDQAPYQTEPVSQGIVNILATPDFSFCMSASSGSSVPQDFSENCNKSRYQNMIAYNTLGQIPQPNTLFDISTQDPNIVQELNSNTLITPLVYTTTQSDSNNNTKTEGLTAKTQAQQAANFIRYVTGSITPLQQPNYDIYQKVLTMATTPPNPKSKPAEFKVEMNNQVNALRSLTSFIGGMRVTAAQASVAYSNLYYIFSKRMPQNLQSGSSGSNSKSSEALNEYVMATRRLSSPTNVQWEKQINEGSAATVQKEIATLLAEINYQLYLNRMQEERILLTNSILVLQNSRMTQPDPGLGTGG